jgi:hypothetical protein
MMSVKVSQHQIKKRKKRKLKELEHINFWPP